MEDAGQAGRDVGAVEASSRGGRVFRSGYCGVPAATVGPTATTSVDATISTANVLAHTRLRVPLELMNRGPRSARGPYRRPRPPQIIRKRQIRDTEAADAATRPPTTHSVSTSGSRGSVPTLIVRCAPEPGRCSTRCCRDTSASRLPRSSSGPNARAARWSSTPTGRGGLDSAFLTRDRSRSSPSRAGRRSASTSRTSAAISTGMRWRLHSSRPRSSPRSSAAPRGSAHRLLRLLGTQGGLPESPRPRIAPNNEGLRRPSGRRRRHGYDLAPAAAGVATWFVRPLAVGTGYTAALAVDADVDVTIRYPASGGCR